ncbi:MAG: GTP cyclohydrolase II [Bacteroidota bacterium]
MEQVHFNSIEEGIAALQAGNMVILTDGTEADNEGVLLMAAEAVTAESVNFMATQGGGLICAPLTSERCEALELGLMAGPQSDPDQTAFTVSVDYLHDGCTTGISARDRARTIQALVETTSKHDDFSRPGHIFPLMAKDGGVLRRAGQTEAAVDLAQLAGFQGAAAIVEIMDDAGGIGQLSYLKSLADKFSLKLITIEDLISYRLKKESLIKKEITVDMPTEFGNFQMTAFKQKNNGDVHLAMTKGSWEEDEPILTRVHSSCITGDIFGSCRCDCGPQLAKALQMVEAEGKGMVLYMNQEGRGIGLVNKLRAYKLQEMGRDTVEANLELGFKMDERDYGVGAQILRAMGVRKMRLMTNNPTKRAGLIGYGLEIVENVPIEIPANPHNEAYLLTKKLKMGHNILAQSPAEGETS